MEKECRTCLKHDSCTKFLEYLAGYCNTDYEPNQDVIADDYDNHIAEQELISDEVAEAREEEERETYYTNSGATN